MAAGVDEKDKKTIVFLHPDLGIGGAERLVVDAAVGLQNRGHKVVIFTSHCDPRHCFDEARDGTLDVRVRGNSIIPPSLLGRFSILCAILRQLHLILQITLLTSELRTLSPSAFFVDQLSAGLPLLKLLVPTSPIFFYCHFPDLLLVQGRQTWYKRLYRLPFDTWEEWSMGFADSIAVNSSFTKGIVSHTWPSLASKRSLEVVHPCIDVRSTSDSSQNPNDDDKDVLPWTKTGIILSINRFERKKDIALAIKAFASLSPEQRGKAKLIIAGGYDNRVHENVSYHMDLVDLAEGAPYHLKTATAKTVVSALNTSPDVEVLFLLSVPNTLKEILLRSAKLLVYTPSNEHFGIVPLEAMLRGVPVLAANNGGPTETVVEGETGWLRDPNDVGEWAKVMDKVLNGMGEEELKRMGKKGVERVKGRFADTQMAERLEEIIERMPKGDAAQSGMILLVVGAAVAAVAGVISAVYWKLW
ncbi:glycosyltransferase family 4 protein [Neurospora crassa]|uniref:Alpha-1,3/1,6-mannosyltransferase alg-2 n=1 Tax=Neurospora crassa (strain ATCC 24698 / 74-OR23-1A / CBS 708.71 / DSM 1257 / FGSC 987) TaxID=367110 RepID=ALG2_NEUCR|nr:mannosyltransferase [Neurospora crassa OR74A]Q8X0H8.1 RecName: Full=Alpha-1,3/1,6-mannosyltransferase alg-2; AltName: Full=Asparagine-linked glycosylation protein 2; AltName: Full=GDP-Man:Man(1)GlcNAc(2)-PP-Dol alpha-1,3-mannosyltransferase; AltName: Full=GDP-Man:Man(1)GlcNAc(2)-PP-dolichol mannosyltransferase; AltName: Full=GDP-Man:Man(2)GlcNAc(2)-PP-Dol alpha-1,6-mannosyltransferase [Neurospora crassa OR74A]EAA26604.1 mannosyltransferase [Neurospora crassa OR74A]KHE79635.1 glycosyltransfera|eukprot:XP_955840.1 mannosyltransferase [Neurospora crassa OR74A]